MSAPPPPVPAAAALATLGAYLQAVLDVLAGKAEPDWTDWSQRLADALGSVLAGSAPAPTEPGDPEPVRLAAIRTVLGTFDCERSDKDVAGDRLGQLVRGERSGAGFEVANGAYLRNADLRTALGALADAADLLEERAGICCDDCDVSPSDLCADHAADLDAAAAYRALARTLGAEL